MVSAAQLGLLIDHRVFDQEGIERRLGNLIGHLQRFRLFLIQLDDVDTRHSLPGCSL